MPAASIAVVCRFALLALLLAARAASGQELIEREADLADRPISAIRIDGLQRTDEQLIRNNIRAAVGDPYEAQTVRGDVNRLYNLGKFKFVTAEAELVADGSVRLIFTFTEQPLIREIQTVGNKAIPDEDLLGAVQLMRGLARDDYLIEKAKRDIEALYRKKGFYLTSVSIDESELQQRGLLIFRVIEGPRVRIKAIEFSGLEAFRPKRLMAEIKTRTHIFILRGGVLDEDVLANDVAALVSFYKDRGYRDVRVDRLIDLSPDNTEAKVTFLVEEGWLYTLSSVRVENADRPGEPLAVFSVEQIAALLEIKTGDVYSQDKLRKSLKAVQDAYGVMGYLDARVAPYELRSGPEPRIDLMLRIQEGKLYKVGLIRINGNFLTKEKVIRRLVRLRSGRPFDSTELEESKRRIDRTRLFGDVRITVQEPDPVDEEYRDVLVEVKEKNTGSMNFGIAVGSDSGLFGEISLIQNNFDIADYPKTFQELVTGRAFRGAGQRFAMTFRPGSEIFQYSVSVTEPHLFETDYSLSGSGSYRQRVYRQYDEERITGSLALHRKLGDIWEAGVRTRAEHVKLSDIDYDAPIDVFEAAGPDNLTALGVSLTRTTIGTITRPGRGSRLELSLDWMGAMGGDYDFYTTQADYTVFLTIREDFLGRKSILKLNSRLGYIFGGDSPTYERFYLGGRSFRGFEFREISPKGIRADNGELGDDPVGGEWLIFLGAQYEFPLFQETITGVVFLDTGTVTRDVGWEDYRVSVGTGLRLYIPQLGPVPIAFDFGFPLVYEDGDDTQLFSFSAELPF
jgi:outer membrane protein insertion porin family